MSKTVQMSESDFLEKIRRRAVASDRVPIPIGDDLAGVRVGHELIMLGSDQVADGVHFDFREHSPRQIARKAVLRNFSDCAAMACLPHAMTATLLLPRGVGSGLASALTEAMDEVGRAFDCPLVGGDTGSWDGGLVIGVSVVGRCEGVGPVLRGGARAGDRIYVSGPLGGSILGRHMEPVPRIALARALAGRGLVHAMIDLSDGLSRDLPRICTASGVGATIDAACVPIHEDVDRLLAMKLGKGEGHVSRTGAEVRLGHALDDGEDYELLIVGREIEDGEMKADLGLIEVGWVEAESGVRLMRGGRVEEMESRGWEHGL